MRTKAREAVRVCLCPSVDDLKRYRDAGASRIVVYSQQTRQEDADGKVLEVVKRLAAVVERAQKVPS